jgi:RHH-type proline utilization regulon transcriptional repressor/proline dehydrogenase/delta 1-pyrroline-5-carboxylate dehydrogenase
VIAPWNFPLAIPTGMTVAALVAGNPVILKPAEQTPASRGSWSRRCGRRRAGRRRAVPARLGEDVGARLVEHPDVAVIASPGRRPVGLHHQRGRAVHRPGSATSSGWSPRWAARTR